jgi:uncharacterized membrane protein
MELVPLSRLLIPTFTLIQQLVLLVMMFITREMKLLDGMKSRSATNAEEMLKEDSLRIIRLASRSDK